MTACARCSTALEDGDLRCAVCALPVPVEARPLATARAQILRCTWCNAAVAFSPAVQAPHCGFCGSVMAIEQPVDPVEEAERRVPFTVHRIVAEASLRQWLGRRGWFAPKALRDEAVLESLTPLAWAGWLVHAQATVTWTADSNAGTHRATWAPHAGTTRLDFDGIIVPASRGLELEECRQLIPFYDVHEAVPVDDEADTELAPQVERFDTQRSSARATVQQAIEAAARDRVRRLIPGGRHRNVHVACLLEGQTTTRIALPAWVMTYRYRDATYRAVVHGQRREVVIGTSPTDWLKVARVVLALVTLAGVAAAILLALR